MTAPPWSRTAPPQPLPTPGAGSAEGSPTDVDDGGVDDGFGLGGGDAAVVPAQRTPPAIFDQTEVIPSVQPNSDPTRGDARPPLAAAAQSSVVVPSAEPTPAAWSTDVGAGAAGSTHVGAGAAGSTHVGAGAAGSTDAGAGAAGPVPTAPRSVPQHPDQHPTHTQYPGQGQYPTHTQYPGQDQYPAQDQYPTHPQYPTQDQYPTHDQYPGQDQYPIREHQQTQVPYPGQQYHPLPDYRPSYTDEGGSGRNRATLIGAAVAAGVAVVAVAGLGVVVLTRDDPPPAGSTPTATAQATVGPPPGDLQLRDDATTITLTWTDPSGGAVPFMVAAGRAGQPLGVMATVDPGRTSYTVNGLNSRVDHCFTVLAVYSTDSFATSGQVCTTRERATPPSGGPSARPSPS